MIFTFPYMEDLNPFFIFTNITMSMVFLHCVFQRFHKSEHYIEQNENAWVYKLPYKTFL